MLLDVAAIFLKAGRVEIIPGAKRVDIVPVPPLVEPAAARSARRCVETKVGCLPTELLPAGLQWVVLDACVGFDAGCPASRLGPAQPAGYGRPARGDQD